MILRRCALATAMVSLLCNAAAQAQVSAQSAVPAQAQAAPGWRPLSAAMLDQPHNLDERGLWMQMDEQERTLQTSNFVIRDAALNSYVHQVFCRLVGAECNTLRIYIIRTPYFNATTAPNGMIQLWSGLFLRARDEAQLAAVLAHEYVHYRDHHSLQLFREAKAKSGVATYFAMFGIVGGC